MDYLNGTKNQIIRYYFFLQRGLALFNECRYLFMAIFGIYFTMRLTNPIWLVVMFCVACPVLIFAGWVAVYHIGKVIDWLNIKYATYGQKYQLEMQERTVKALEEINAKCWKS